MLAAMACTKGQNMRVGRGRAGVKGDPYVGQGLIGMLMNVNTPELQSGPQPQQL